MMLEVGMTVILSSTVPKASHLVSTVILGHYVLLNILQFSMRNTHRFSMKITELYIYIYISYK